MKPEYLGSLVGLATGIGFFFRLPTLANAVLGIGLLTVLGILTGFLMSKFGSKKGLGAGIMFILLVLTGLWLSGSGCDFSDLIQPPAENQITGEKVEGGFEGFRFMPCDKGQYPWYYETLERENPAICEEIPESSYCSNKTVSNETIG